MYKKVSTDMNFVEREKEVEKFWADNDIFRKSMKGREGKPMYTFYDGPPTANGKPHIGHVLTVWSHLLTNVKKASGNTKVCGRISPAPSDSGRIWMIPM